MTKIEGDTPIYVVWGPTAEWGDGTGPLGYFADRDGAELFIEDELHTLRDVEAEGPAAWPYEGVDADSFTAIEESVATLVPQHWEYGFTDVEDVLDYLNLR